MSSDVALRVSGLGKSYTIRHQDHDHVTLAQSALHRLRHPRSAQAKETFWALRDVDFEVPRGEVLGIIGRNGAGKSTLLKILSRITPPTTGRVEVFGRVGSLLEVGTGFHPELTGRENVYLNGSILGMKKSEIDKQFDAIVDFAGVEQFLDTPVKRYSSGMYVRLAFAVAAHLESDILIIDEVLSVGDAAFQKKSLDAMRDAAQGGRTVLLVSHQLPTVSVLADRVLLLDDGAAIAAGNPAEVISEYEGRARIAQQDDIDLGEMPRFVNVVRQPPVRLARLRFPYGPTLSERDELVIDIDVDAHQPCRASFGVGFNTPDHAPVGLAYSPALAFDSTGPHSVQLRLEPLQLVPGPYVVSLSVVDGLDQGMVMEFDGVAGAAWISIHADPRETLAWSRHWGARRLPAPEVRTAQVSLR